MGGKRRGVQLQPMVHMYGAWVRAGEAEERSEECGALAASWRRAGGQAPRTTGESRLQGSKWPAALAHRDVGSTLYGMYILYLLYHTVLWYVVW